MDIKGKGNLLSENLESSGAAINYVYVCQVDGEISFEPPEIDGMGRVDKEE